MSFQYYNSILGFRYVTCHYCEKYIFEKTFHVSFCIYPQKKNVKSFQLFRDFFVLVDGACFILYEKDVMRGKGLFVGVLFSISLGHVENNFNFNIYSPQ